jgi:hypothetical protein
VKRDGYEIGDGDDDDVHALVDTEIGGSTLPRNVAVYLLDTT